MSKIHKRIQYFERINFYCPMKESKKWIEYYFKQGYKIIRGGPKIKSWPEINPERYHMIIEREIIKNDLDERKA